MIVNGTLTVFKVYPNVAGLISLIRRWGCYKEIKAFCCAHESYPFFRLCKHCLHRCALKKPHLLSTGKALITLVGVAGFEPAASTSQMWRDTGLRYIPKGNAKVSFIITAANIFWKKLLNHRDSKNNKNRLCNLAITKYLCNNYMTTKQQLYDNGFLIKLSQ